MKNRTVDSYQNNASGKDIKSSKNANNISGNEVTLLQNHSDLKQTYCQSDNPKVFSQRDNINRRKLSLWRRFFNLPIGNKQLIALIASEMVGVLGIGVVGMLLVHSKLQNLSLEQAKSEVAVTDIAYNIKIDQMGFGFRGQSDNTALIQAAQIHVSGKNLNTELEKRVRKILRNEVAARKIEYATLVGKDLKIIANANSNRQGEIWNPNNLITEVLKNPRQIKASKIVKWSEIQRESPPLPNNFKNQNALIRYTVTPIKDPQSGKVLAALVSGDIVNGKSTILRDTLESTRRGYSAIYMLQPTGKYSLVTSLQLKDSDNISDANLNVNLPPVGEKLIQEAAIAKGKVITERLRVGDRTYAMAFQAIPSKVYDAYDAPVYDPKRARIKIFNQQPTAVLVRGTPETTLNQLLREAFWVQIVTIFIAWMIMLIWAYILRKSIIKPIEHLGSIARKFASGDDTGGCKVRAEIFATDEVGQLAASFNQMADKISDRSLDEAYRLKLNETARGISLLSKGTFNLTGILRGTVTSIKEAIKADRVIVYRLSNHEEGEVIAESFNSQWLSTDEIQTPVPNFSQYYLSKHLVSTPLAIENIYLTNLSKSQIAVLLEFAIKALLIVPIVIDNKLYGFLVAQQCSSPRKWKESEINLLQQLTTSLGYALDKAYLIEKLDKHRQSNINIEEEKVQQEIIKNQIERLILDFQSVANGDLTVQAEVVPGRIGILAKHFNSAIADFKQLVERLRKSKVDFYSTVERIQSSVETISANLESSERLKKIIPSTVTLVDNTQKAVELAKDTSEVTQKNAIAINTAVKDVSNLYVDITQTGQRVERLRNNAADIEGTLAYIKQITTQTHLLAINLGLDNSDPTEASQEIPAGNAELGELALRCANATQEIEESLELIKQSAKDIIAEIQQQSDRVVGFNKIAEDSRVSVNQIEGLCVELTDLIDSISQVSVSQLNTLQDEEELISEFNDKKQLSTQYLLDVADTLQDALEVFQDLEKTVDRFKTS